MKLNNRFAREAARGAVVMLVIPLGSLFILSWLIGPSFDWEDWARGGTVALGLYVLVMVRRWRERFQ